MRETLWATVERILKYNTPHRRKDQRKVSGAKWLELKGKFDGKRCFIIGSAPSVKQLDLTKLDNEYTFTCNKTFLLKDLGLKKSSFYTIIDKFFYQDFKEQIDVNWAEYFFISAKIPWDIAVDNLFYFNSSGAAMRRGFFQLDLQQPLATGDTVVLKMLQIAVYLGFKEIIFIGVDLDYSSNNPYFYQPAQNEAARITNTGVLENILKNFEYAADFLAQQGVKLYNASPAGSLDCMPRVKYEELF